MSNVPGTTQPGDSKSTSQKLSDDAHAVGQNIQDTAATYQAKADTKATADKDAAKAESAGMLQSAGDTAAAVGQNLQGTAQHYAEKAQDSMSTSNTSGSTTTGSTTSQQGEGFVATAQAVAANVMETASKVAGDAANYLSGASSEKK